MKRVWGAVAVALAVVLSAGGFVWWHAMRELKGAGASVASEKNFKFDLRRLGPAINTGFEWISSPTVFSSAVVFQNHLYVAGPAGLTEYDSRGTLLREFRVGRELPAAPLRQLTAGLVPGAAQPQLIIATDGEGVLLFDGQTFQQIRPADADARAVTALLPLRSGQLLIGTMKRGVLAFDGSHLGEFHSQLADLKVAALAGDEADLWVGTLDRGVVHLRGGRVETFTDTEGLPDAAVYAIAQRGASTYVGTSTGVVEFVDGKLSRTIGKGSFARALFADDSRVYVGAIDAGVTEIDLNGSRLHAAGLRTSGPTDVQQMFRDGDTLYAIAADGVYKRTSSALGWQRVLQQGSALLADRNISALAGDEQGRIWVGYFDRGLDVIDERATRARHVEDDHVFCVNRIVADPVKREVNVATANGLVIFDSAANERRVLGRADGLMADHVTDVVLRGGEKVIATPAGLTFMDASGARSLYAFHGLVNNHVYALGISGDKVLAGTLGGASMILGDRILSNYTTASSGLKHNWVTAVAPVDGDWFVGTYGAGVMRMDESGRVQAMDVATAAVDVNPNAMVVTPAHVVAGTLTNGLYIYNRQFNKWSTKADGLPSRNVTALAAIGGYIYIGTDNGLVRISEANLEQ